MVRPSLRFETVRKHDYRTVIRRVKDTDVPDTVERKHVPRVHITALSGYGRNWGIHYTAYLAVLSAS